MSLMDKIRSTPATGIVFAVVLLALAGLIFWQQNRRPKPPQQWYYDLTANELITVAGQDGASPITLPSGHEAVSAVMFACGSCEDKSQHFVGYLSKVEFVPLRGAGGQPTGLGDEMVPLSTVRNLEEDRWFNSQTPEGQRIVQAAQARCQGRAKTCDPD